MRDAFERGIWELGWRNEIFYMVDRKTNHVIIVIVQVTDEDLN